jgi:hypothetical protein
MLGEAGGRRPPERSGRPVRSAVDLSTVTHDQALNLGVVIFLIIS